MNADNFTITLFSGVVLAYFIYKYHQMIYNQLSEQCDRYERDRNYWRAVASELYDDSQFLNGDVDDL